MTIGLKDKAKLLTTNFDNGRTITEKNIGGQAHEGGHEAAARYEDGLTMRARRTINVTDTDGEL
jgi:hypothetical protein